MKRSGSSLLFLNTANWDVLMEDVPYGGILLKSASPQEQATLINHLQNKTKIPLLCFLDAEIGLGMRMEKPISFPNAMTLGAISDDALLLRLGEIIGEQCREVGGHVNLAPIVDVNSNPKNPIIHLRSFGDDPEKVSHHASLLAKGMRKGGIYPCIKHFPGHGDVEIDSHIDLPKISKGIDALKNVELKPFADLIKEGIPMVMTGHLLVQKIDDKNPSSLSAYLIQGLLQKELGFSGLVITDALNMQALSLYKSHEDIAVEALFAGNDMLLYGDHIDANIDRIIFEIVPKAFKAIKERVPEEIIDQKVKKILKVKNAFKIERKISMPRQEILHSEEAYALKRELYRSAITSTFKGKLPQKIQYVHIGKDDLLRPYLEKEGVEFGDSDTLIISLSEMKSVEIPQDKRVILCVFTSPYALLDKHFDEVLLGYENVSEAAEAACDVLMGKLEAKGTCPIHLNLSRMNARDSCFNALLKE